MKISARGHFSQDCVEHVGGALHVDPTYARRRRQTNRPAHEHHFRTGFTRRLRNRKSHLSRAAIADEAHRVDPFTSRSSRNQHAPPLQRTTTYQQHTGAINQLEWLQHATGANLATRLVSLAGSQHLNIALLQSRHIGACCRIGPHHPIHCRRNRDWRFGCETQSREQIVGLAGGQASQEIGTGRGDEHQLRPTRELNVPHGGFGGRIPQVRAHRPPGHCLKRRGGHKLARSRGHYHLNFRPLLAQPAHEIRALVGGDSAGHSEQYAFALHQRSCEGLPGPRFTQLQ